MKFSTLFFLMFLAVSCNNDNSENGSQTSKTALKLVTGLTLRQNFDDTPLVLGNPNTFTDDKFLLYPNPANNMIVITAEDNIAAVWFVAAEAENIYQQENFGNLLNSNTFSEEAISSTANFAVTGQTSNYISLGMESFTKGYYKVFVKINGQIYWDNLYKYGDDQGNEEQFNELNNFWN